MSHTETQWKVGFVGTKVKNYSEKKSNNPGAKNTVDPLSLWEASQSSLCLSRTLYMG